MHRQNNRKSGTLTVIYGPMFSGKTSKLVVMVEVYSRMKYRVVTIKPKIDTRYSDLEEIHSHDHRTSKAIIVDGESPESVFEEIISLRPDKVIVDEAQFFHHQNILQVIHRLLQTGIDVIAAGLLYDYKRQPFGAMPDLLGLADEHIELTAICQKCGGVAHHSERTGGGGGTINIGAADKYIAVCAACHHIYPE